MTQNLIFIFWLKETIFQTLFYSNFIYNPIFYSNFIYVSDFIYI